MRRLRFSIVGTLVAKAIGASAGVDEVRAGLATMPDFLLLWVFPTSFFYTPAWNNVLIGVFTLGVIGFHALVLYVIFGGVAWWRGL